MAFKPTFINGRHYLMSKNSGSFPNWAIYLSGSSGQGKLWSEFNIDASVSCSVSSSTTFVTGSVYQVDVRILPGVSASGIYVNGQTEGGVLGNGGGSLSSTASLFVGNYSLNNTQNFSGSIYTVKSYTIQSFEQPPLNFNATATRIQKKPIPFTPKIFELLVVAGGGGGGLSRGGGGGAGGLQYFMNYNLTPSFNTVIVGNNGSVGTDGGNSTFSSLISFGGGGGGTVSIAGRDGGSGGGGGGAGGGEAGGTGGLGTPGQGNDGYQIPAGGTTGIGGGGAGTAGQVRDGGSGSYIPSFAAIGGSPAGWFAGGGGSSGNSSRGFGGIGGGGNGGISATGVTGSANTGGGGGGGAIGGSGIVAIRYNGAPIALGGEITQSEGFTYHVFRTVGTSSFTIF
jgi:hypothetical protein